MVPENSKFSNFFISLNNSFRKFKNFISVTPRSFQELNLEKVEIIKGSNLVLFIRKKKVEENSQNFLGIGNYFPEKDALTFVKHLQPFHSSF